MRIYLSVLYIQPRQTPAVGPAAKSPSWALASLSRGLDSPRQQKAFSLSTVADPISTTNEPGGLALEAGGEYRSALSMGG